MPQVCEARCNKIATVPVWDKIIMDKVSALTKQGLDEILRKVKSVF